MPEKNVNPFAEDIQKIKDIRDGVLPQSQENTAFVRNFMSRPEVKKNIAYKKFDSLQNQRSDIEGGIIDQENKLAKIEMPAPVDQSSVRDATSTNNIISDGDIRFDEKAREGLKEHDIAREGTMSAIESSKGDLSEVNEQITDIGKDNVKDFGFKSGFAEDIDEKLKESKEALDVASQKKSITANPMGMGAMYTNPTDESRREVDDLADIRDLYKKMEKVVNSPSGTGAKDQLNGLMYGLTQTNTAKDFFTLGLSQMKRDLNATDAFSKYTKEREAAAKEFNYDPEGNTKEQEDKISEIAMGTLEDSEAALLDAYKMFLEVQGSSEANFMTGIGGGLQEMLPFIAQFAATGGAANAASTVVKNAIAKRTERAAISKLAGGLTATLVQSSLMVPATARNLGERMAPSLNIEGNLEKGENFGAALGKSFATTLAEVTGERAADVIQEGFKASRALKLRTNPEAANNFLNKVAEKLIPDVNIPSVQGLPFELIGEEITAVQQAIIDQDASAFSADAQAQLFVTVAFASSGAYAGSVPKRVATRKRYESSAKEFSTIEDQDYSEAINNAVNTINDPVRVLTMVDALGGHYGVPTADQAKAKAYAANSIAFTEMNTARKAQMNKELANFKDNKGGITTTTIGEDLFYIKNIEDLGKEGKVIYVKDKDGEVNSYPSESITEYNNMNSTQLDEAIDSESKLQEDANIAQEQANEAAQNKGINVGQTVKTSQGTGTVRSINADGTITATAKNGEPFTIPMDESEVYKTQEQKNQEKEDAKLVEDAKNQEKVNKSTLIDEALSTYGIDQTVSSIDQSIQEWEKQKEDATPEEERLISEEQLWLNSEKTRITEAHKVNLEAKAKEEEQNVSTDAEEVQTNDTKKDETKPLLLSEMDGDFVEFEGKKGILMQDDDGVFILRSKGTDYVVSNIDGNIDGVKSIKQAIDPIFNQNNTVTVRGKNYTVQINDNGNVESLTDEEGNVVRNENWLIKTEIARNKLDQETIEKKETDLGISKEESMEIESILNKNMTSTIAGLLENGMNESTKDYDFLITKLWAESAIVSLEQINTPYALAQADALYDLLNILENEYTGQVETISTEQGEEVPGISAYQIKKEQDQRINSVNPSDLDLKSHIALFFINGGKMKSNVAIKDLGLKTGSREWSSVLSKMNNTEGLTPDEIIEQSIQEYPEEVQEQIKAGLDKNYTDQVLSVLKEHGHDLRGFVLAQVDNVSNQEDAQSKQDQDYVEDLEAKAKELEMYGISPEMAEDMVAESDAPSKTEVADEANVPTESKESQEDGPIVPAPEIEAPFRTAEQSKVANSLIKAIKDISEDVGLPVVMVTEKNMDSMPTELRTAYEARGRGVKGVYYDGKVYIFPKAATSIKDIKQTYLHEVIGHYGLRNLLEPKFNAVLDKIYETISPETIAKYEKQEGTTDKRVITDEYLADIAMTAEKPSWWSSFVSSIRELLRKRFNIEYSQKDIEAMLQQSRDAIGKDQIRDNSAESRMRQTVDENAVEIEEQVRFRAEPSEQIDSKKFNEWFGNSEVVNEDGSPRVVYHGTNSSFNTFDSRKQQTTAHGYGFYFATEKNVAKGYQRGNEGRLLEAYLAIEKPLKDDAPNFEVEELEQVLNEMLDLELEEYADEMESWKDSFLSNMVDTYSMDREDAISEVANSIFDYNDTANDQIAELSNIIGNRQTTQQSVKNTLGYDGIYVKDFQETDGDVYIAWFPNQVKSATENSGEFSANSDDIRFRVAESQQELDDFVKDSKVKETVYHGTPKEGLEDFDLDQASRNSGNFGHYGNGVYFSRAERESATYGDNIINAKVNIKKPFIGSKEQWDELYDAGLSLLPKKKDLSYTRGALWYNIKKVDPVAAKLFLLIDDKGYTDGWKEFLKENSIEDSKIDLNIIGDIHEEYEKNEGIGDNLNNDLESIGIDISKLETNVGFGYLPPLHYLTELGDYSKTKEFTDAIKELGYDGVFYGTEVVAFSNDQILIEPTEDGDGGDGLRFRVDESAEDAVKRISDELIASLSSSEFIKGVESKLESTENVKKTKYTHTLIKDRIKAIKQGVRLGEKDMDKKIAKLQGEVIDYAKKNTDLGEAGAREVSKLLTIIKNTRDINKIEKAFDDIDAISSNVKEKSIVQKDISAINALIKQVTSPRKQGNKKVAKFTYDHGKEFDRLKDADKKIKSLVSIVRSRKDKKGNDRYTAEEKDAAVKQLEEMISEHSEVSEENPKGKDDINVIDNVIAKLISLRTSGTKASSAMSAQVRAELEYIKELATDDKFAEEFENWKTISREKAFVNRMVRMDKLSAKSKFKQLSQKRRNQLLDSTGNWDSILTELGGLKLQQRFSFVHNEINQEVGVQESMDRLLNSAIPIFGVKTKNDVLKIIQEMNEETFAEIPQPFERGREREGQNIKLSKMHVIDIYNAIQQEDIKQDYYATYGEDIVNDLVSKLTDSDKEFALSMAEIVRSYHDKVNPVFVRLTNRDMPKNANYWMSTADREGSVDVMADQIQRSALPSFTKARTARRVPKVANAFDKFSNHIVQSEWYINMAEDLTTVSKVFKDANVRNLINDAKGDVTTNNPFTGMVDGFISALEMDNDTSTATAYEKKFGSLLNNWITAKIGLNPSVFVKQLGSMINYSENMPMVKWATQTAKNVLSPKWKSTVKYMWENSPYLKTRFEGGYSEALQYAMDAKSSVPKAKTWHQNRKNDFTVLTRIGDMGAIIFGGKAYVDYLMKEGGMTEKEAFEKFEEDTIASQQSPLTSTLSKLQRDKSPFKRALFTFANTPSQYMRKMYDANAKYRHGDISKKQLAKTYFIYGVANQIAYIGAGALMKAAMSGVMPDEDDFLKSLLIQVATSPIAGIPIVRNVVDPTVKEILGLDTYDQEMPVTQQLIDLSKTMTDFLGAEDEEKRTKALKKFGILFSEMFGAPTYNVIKASDATLGRSGTVEDNHYKRSNSKYNSMVKDRKAGVSPTKLRSKYGATYTGRGQLHGIKLRMSRYQTIYNKGKKAGNKEVMDKAQAHIENLQKKFNESSK